MTLRGVDVSKHQGVIDYDAAKASGLAEYVISKATEGVGFTDPRFFYNWTESGRVNALRGAYHFARPDLGNAPETEADWYLSRVTLDRPGDFPVLDYEPKTVTPTFEDSTTAVPWCLAFLERVRLLTGLRAFLYLNLSQARKVSPNYDWSPVVAAGYPLWLAFYDQEELDPPPLTQWPTVTLEQWTSVGTVPGIGGPVDRNIFRGTREDLAKYGLGGSMDEEQVKAIIRGMLESPEGALKVRASLTRPSSDSDPVVEGQLRDSEAATRRWINPGEWVLVKGTPHVGQTLTYVGTSDDQSAFIFTDETGATLTLIRR